MIVLGIIGTILWLGLLLAARYWIGEWAHRRRIRAIYARGLKELEAVMKDIDS